MKNLIIKIEDLISKILIAYGGLNVSYCCRGVAYEVEIPKELQENLEQ